LLAFATPRSTLPDRDLDPMNIEPIDGSGFASVGRPKPRLGVSKGQEKGKVF